MYVCICICIHVNVCQRDNVVYWKTNGKINNDLHVMYS